MSEQDLVSPDRDERYLLLHGWTGRPVDLAADWRVPARVLTVLDTRTFEYASIRVFAEMSDRDQARADEIHRSRLIGLLIEDPARPMMGAARYWASQQYTGTQLDLFGALIGQARTVGEIRELVHRAADPYGLDAALAGYDRGVDTLGQLPARLEFSCPGCGLVAVGDVDAREGWCTACEWWTADGRMVAARQDSEARTLFRRDCVRVLEVPGR
jgi:hypothetical protein